MTRTRQHGFRPLAALVALALLTPALVGQGPDDERARPTAAALPESNEALLFSSRIEEATQSGDYRLAIELLERMRDLPSGLVAAPASRTYYPVWRQAFRLMGQLPTPGIELYRQLHDAEVTARFHEAAAAAHVGVLRELFRNYRLSSAWGAVGIELAGRLLDQGAYGEAIEVLHEMSQAGAGTAWEHKAQLAVALASAGAMGSAERLLAELESAPELTTRPQRQERLEQLRHWFMVRRADHLGSVIGHGQPFMPRIQAGPVWARGLLAEMAGRVVDEGDDIAQAVALLRRLPLHQPVLEDQTLVVRLHGRVWALDAGTLMLRWSVAERSSDHMVGLFTEVGSDADAKEDVQLSPEAELLLSNHLRHVVSVGFGQVYSVERLALFDAQFDAFGQRPLPVAGGSMQRNELVARDLRTGQLAWQTGAEAASPLFDVAFQNAPMVVGEALVAPIQRGEELNLAVLDPTDGNLLREVPLLGPPTHFAKEGGRCLMVSDETALYVCTGNGVVAALARDDLAWKWATVYPSTLAERLGQLWWQPPQTAIDWPVAPPVIADDLLIVAPVDSPQMFALDRFSGQERWRMSRQRYPFLIGALPGGVLVGGQEVACLDLLDPVSRPARWKSVPLEITGRAVIQDNRVYLPTREGIVVLDGRTGKVLADQVVLVARGQRATTPPSADANAAPESLKAFAAVTERTANLLASDDALFSVSPSRIVKYPDLLRARARYASPTGEGGLDERDELIQAWLDALEGHFEEASARLQGRPFADPKLTVAHDHLLTYVFLGLADGAPAGEDRLSWLQRALALADSPDSAGRLAVAIGRALEEGGRWAAALRHYGEMLRQAGAHYVEDAADGHRRLASWLHAAAQIRAVYDKAPAGACEELLSQMLRRSDDEEQRVSFLQRLRVALGGSAVRERVDQLLCLQNLPPEIKVRYLPTGGFAALSGELRRRLHLERWDTDVSLGRLEQARQDREVWYAQFADSAPAPLPASQPVGFEPLSSRDERERVDAIELAYRKLTLAHGQPFTEHLVRQWKIERAELLLDMRRTSAMPPVWLLVADWANRRLALVNVYKHQYPQRQTKDRMTTGWAASANDMAGSAEALEGRRLGAGEARINAWPMATYQQLAAVPVQGGLVCVGLGPERYAGRRLWEHAVPEWGSIPSDFADRAVAGRQGVFFTPRRDRVALAGWFDGQLWWQRDLPETTVERLHLADDALVIVGDDGRAWVTDATFGRVFQPVPTGPTPARRIDALGDTIVVWTAESVTGITATWDRAARHCTFDQIWTHSSDPVEDAVTVAGRPWIAYRVRDRGDWHLLDVRDGQAVFDASLGVFEAVSAAVVTDGRLFVAGQLGPLDEDGRASVTHVAAFDAVDGSRYWSRDFRTSVPVNVTQLAGHPDLIPVLLAAADESPAEEASWPAIQLVSRATGDLCKPFSIKDDFKRLLDATCEMYVLTTPTRIVVQVAGNLIAYGNSPLRSAP